VYEHVIFNLTVADLLVAGAILAIMVIVAVTGERK
jgi:hypothetical protein